MTDILLELSRNPTARGVVKALGLPIPMPEPLRRARTGYTDRPLEGTVALFGGQGGPLCAAVGDALVQAGGDVRFAGPDAARASFAEAAEAFGRPIGTAVLDDSDARYDALVLDGSTLSSPAELHALWEFFHPTVRQVGRCGRIVVLGRPGDQTTDAATAAARQALDGFVRSLAKEVGKRGTTANLLLVDEGAEDRVAGPLRFLLSAHSAYVSGQPIRVGTVARAASGAWKRPLEGRNALVTGAARGIGRATATVLAREGARVFCLDRPDDQDEAATLAREIGGEVLGVDLGAPDAADRIAEAARAVGGFDIVVHNAGVTRDRTIANMKPEYWDLALDVNLGAVVRITERLLHDKLVNADGRIVCLSSTSGIAGNMGQTNYGAAKAGIIGYVRALAPRAARRGVTVNAIAPGFIETRMTAAMPTGLREVARRLNSLGQGGRPVDVAEAVTFLATPHASGVSGQVLRVCGQALVGA